MNVDQLAREALAKIAATPKGHVYASGRGKVAAAPSQRQPGKNTTYYAFRRVGKKVRFEIWPDGLKRGAIHSLPADLEAQAALMLDSL